MKMTIKVFDRRTEVRVSKDSEIDLIDILNSVQIKGKIFNVRFYGDTVTYKIDRRLYIKEKIKLEKRLCELVGLPYKPVEHVQKKPWTKPVKQNKDENIITGFVGCLINEFQYT